MRQINYTRPVRRVLAAILTVFLLLSLFTVTSLAATAIGSASTMVGTNTINIALNSGQFSSTQTDVENTGNWVLSALGDQTVQSVRKNSSTFVTITLSAVVETGNTFTLQADAAVFEAGTEPFGSPISVTVYTPTPAQGTATAAAGTRDITVTLTYANFHSQSRVENKNFWILGGASASTNPIESVTWVDLCNATVTMTNNISAEDDYTIQIDQALLPNIATVPFTSPLEVEITGGTATAPSVPKALQAIPGNGQVELIWATPDSDGGSAITGYQVSNDNGGHWTDASSNTSHTFIGLNNGQSYTFQVRAVNGVGEGAYAIVTAAPIAGNVCTVSGGGSYSTLDEALALVEDGQTITLLQDIDHNSGIVIDGIIVIFNLGGYTLNVTNYSGTGLEVKNNGCLQLFGDSSELNVTGTSYGVLADNGSIHVTNVHGDTGARAVNNGHITIDGDSNGSSIGVSANGAGSSVIVSGTSVGGTGGSGASASFGGAVTVGNIIVTGGNHSCGANVEGGGTVTVEGTITAPYYHISVDYQIKTIDDKTIPTTKPGYHTYQGSVSSVWVKDNTPPVANVCSIGEVGYTTLAGALAAVAGATPTMISILTDINHIGAVHLTNKNITFDLNGHIVNISTSEVATTALIVDGGSLGLGGSGELNVTGMAHGIKVLNGGTATVTSAKVTGGSSGIAAAAEVNGTLVVLGDAIATSYPDCAVLANFGGSVTVNGNAQSVWQAAFAGHPAVSGGRKATVYIKGNATATGTTSDSAAVHAIAGSEITIDGTLTPDVADRYIRVGNSAKTITDNTIPTTMTGYYTYTDGTSTVWVKDNTVATNVCAIGATGYATLGEALAAVQDGQTIRLLSNIDYDGGISITEERITFDLNGFVLNVTNSVEWSTGLSVIDGGVSLIGDGEFNVAGDSYGVRVEGATSTVTVTNASGAASGANVDSVGACATENGKITITGSTIGSRCGAYAEVGGEISIGGNSTATAPTPYDSFGARAESGGIITIAGNAIGQDRAIYVYNQGSIITVGDCISTSTGTNSSRIAVQVDNMAQAFIHGDVTVNSIYGTAVFVSSRSEVTIDGTIHHNGRYIRIYPDELDESDRTIPTTKSGYHTYSTEEGTVWVKNTAASNMVCAIGGAEYATLNDALATITDSAPTTITILSDINHGAAVMLENKNITFALNGHTVSISTDDAREIALTVNGGSLNLSGSGALNVTGRTHGVTVYNNANVTVSNVTIIGGTGVDAACAGLGGNLVVLGNALCIGDGITISTGYAAFAETGGSVTVNGDAQSYGVIACAKTQGTVHIKGDVIEYPSYSYTSSGASAYDDGQITIDGVIIAECYLYVGHTLKIGTDITTPTTKSGYYTYTDGTNTVWVKNTEALEVTGIAVKTQPTDLVYTAGQVLDLSGLVVTLDYNDGSTLDVEYEDFSFMNITTDPVNGTTMTVAAHHNQPVAVSCNGQTAYTNNLMVTAVPTYTVTFDSRSGSLVASITGVTSGSAITAPVTPTRSGYTFGGWYKESACTNAWNFSVDTVTVNITLYARWTSNSGGGGGGSIGSSTPVTPVYKADVSGISAVETTIPVDVNTDTGSAVTDLEALGADNIFDGGTAVITVPSIPGVNSYTMGIPAASLSGSQGEDVLTFSTGTGSITIPAHMLTGMTGTEGKKAGITIGQGDKSRLPDDVKAAIGDRPIVQITLTLDGTPAEWNNPNAPVTISIPYTPTADELTNPESIVIWFIDGNGNVVEVPSGRYDPETGTVTFSTTHLSNYAVAYLTKTFDDLGSAAWAKKPIEVLASKGILKGISDTEYAPQRNITRADFLYFLIRTLGVDAKFDGNFGDIDRAAYYYKEIGIAKKLGITSGTGNNKFTPDASITRQDMMVLTEKALRMLKKLKVEGTASDLDKFADKSLVAAYAVNSAASVVKEGLISGSSGKVNPLGNTTRAEAAALLYQIYNKYP